MSNEVTCPLAKNRPALIAIAVGIFLAGLGIGYAIFANSYNNPMAMMQDPQHMQVLLQNPEFAQKWTQVMMGNPSGRHYLGDQMASSHELMLDVMQRQQFQQQMMNSGMMGNMMTGMMAQNQTFGQEMMMSMMNNTQTRQQMMDTMMHDPQFAQQMLQNMKQNHQLAMDIIKGMMNDTSLRTQMLGHMTENQAFMQQMRDFMSSQNTTSGMMMGGH